MTKKRTSFDVFATERINTERKKIETQICDLQEKYIPDFMLIDIGYGILGAIFTCAILAWIPIIGWMAIPFTILIIPFGPIIRKKTCIKQIAKLKKELEALS